MGRGRRETAKTQLLAPASKIGKSLNNVQYLLGAGRSSGFYNASLVSWKGTFSFCSVRVAWTATLLFPGLELVGRSGGDGSDASAGKR